MVDSSTALPTQARAPSRTRGVTRARVRELASRAADLFPWTPLGMGLGLGSYAALRAFAYAQLDLVWLVTGYAAVGLCALCPVFVIIGAILLRVQTRAPAGEDTLVLETVTPAATGFSLLSLRFLPLTQVRWQWLSPRDVDVTTQSERGRVHELVAFSDRGLFDAIERRVIVEDPFGLARIAFRLRQTRTLRVLPRVAGLRHLPSLVSLAAGQDLPHPMGLEDGDRLELQRYSPSDPARFIHWKVFARTRRLMVRKPERAVAIARRAAAFYVASTQDDATSAVARLALERGLLGNEWVFGTDLDAFGTTRVDAALSALIATTKARDVAAKGLHAFLAQVEKQGPASVILFVPARPGPWLDIVVAAARRRHVRAVIGVDGVASPLKRSWWARLIASPRDMHAVALPPLEEVLSKLGRAGIAMTVLDRATGRHLGDVQRHALARGKQSSGLSSQDHASMAGGMR